MKNSSKLFKFINATLLSKSAKPLSKIEVIIKLFCLGKLPMIVSKEDGDISTILSPISRSNEKLNSFPIEIESFCKLFLIPLKFSLLIISSFSKSNFE